MLFCTSKCSVLKLFIILYVFRFLGFMSEAAPSFRYGICQNATTYKPNTTYQANLNTLLSTLSNNTDNNLFYNTTVGENAPDRAYGLFMCRGDVTNDLCRDCVVAAAKEIVKRCPKEREAYIWYDECMLRYNNITFFSNMSVLPRGFLWYPGSEVMQPIRLAQILETVMNNLATRASSSNQSLNTGRLKGFATEETDFTSFQTLYNLVQCTPDLSGADCKRCFRVAISLLPTCCGGDQGGRVMLPSCTIRYEMYPFYTITTAPPPLPATTTPPPPASGPSTSPGGKQGLSTPVIIGIVVGVVSSVFLFALLGFCFLRSRTKKYDSIQEATDGTEISTVESLQYKLSTIVAATNNFSAEYKIGEGGFGDVFKGKLANGKEIAVKRLSASSGQGGREFKNEVVLVSKLQHKNLVRLVGFCLERKEKILVYEFVPNKSLDHFLFDQEKQQVLDWSMRYKIIRGTARGILYLHEDSRLRIIHRDLKASNVLLDRDMNPKISDFGMARIFGVDQSQADTSRIVGTIGYMAPEYAMHGQISVKSDVFSFGVLTLEVISGKKNTSFYDSGGSQDLINHAWKLWRDGTPLELTHPHLGDSFDRNEIIRCIHIGLLCVQEDPDERPDMATIVLMLNSEAVTLAIPNEPAFFINTGTETMPRPLESDETSSKSMPWSANEVSITELYPR